MKAPVYPNIGLTVIAQAQRNLQTFLNRGISNLFLYEPGYPTTLTRKRCWAYGPNYSSISPWNSYGGNKRGGILLDTQYALFAEHYRVPVGTTIKWVSMKNVSVSRKVTKTYTFPRLYSDLWLVKLDSPIPKDVISPTKLFTSNMVLDLRVIESYDSPYGKSSSYDIAGLPIYYTDYEEKLGLQEGRWVTVSHEPRHYTHSSFVIQTPTDLTWQKYYEPIRAGDSGGPIWTVIFNEMYFLGLFSSGGGGTLLGDPEKIAWLKSLGVSVSLPTIHTPPPTINTPPPTIV